MQTNLTISEVVSHNPLEVIIVTMVCDTLNIAALLCGICQMYLAIEIGHPVYATLFCNLISVLLSSTLEIVAIPFLEYIRVKTFVKNCTAFVVIFHACTWLVMSVLRYLYIVHNNWVHKTFPDARKLTVLSLCLTYCIYCITISTFLPLFFINKWPYIEVIEMEMTDRIACSITFLGSYICILGISSIFYTLILHQRGSIGKNCVGVLPAGLEDNELTRVSKRNDFNCTIFSVLR
jgi:hypothetical protein